jgi:hypothetical protein
MPSIHLSAVALVILATLPLVGCSHSLDAGWPPGTEAIVSNAAGGIVAAGLPRNQQAKIWNDWVVLESQSGGANGSRRGPRDARRSARD